MKRHDVLRPPVLMFLAAFVTVLGLLVLFPVRRVTAAPARLSQYQGIHPVWPQTGGFCYIDVPHFHSKGPTDLRVYRVLANGENLFVGDPVALGYDGPKFGYFGPHPLNTPGRGAADGMMYCYLRGPHFHAQPPDAAGSFVLKQGTYWFTGTFPPEFDRDRFNIWINDSPILSSYQPPKVSLADAPPGYHLPDAVQPPPVVAQPTPPVPARKSNAPKSKTGLR